MQKFIHSAKELSKLQNLVLCAAFGAISIILGSLSISIGNTLKIGFGSIPNQFVAALFGPVTAGLFAGRLVRRRLAGRDGGVCGHGHGLFIQGILFGYGARYKNIARNSYCKDAQEQDYVKACSVQKRIEFFGCHNASCTAPEKGRGGRACGGGAPMMGASPGGKWKKGLRV